MNNVRLRIIAQFVAGLAGSYSYSALNPFHLSRCWSLFSAFFAGMSAAFFVGGLWISVLMLRARRRSSRRKSMDEIQRAARGATIPKWVEPTVFPEKDGK